MPGGICWESQTFSEISPGLAAGMRKDRSRGNITQDGTGALGKDNSWGKRAKFDCMHGNPLPGACLRVAGHTVQLFPGRLPQLVPGDERRDQGHQYPARQPTGYALVIIIVIIISSSSESSSESSPTSSLPTRSNYFLGVFRNSFQETSGGIKAINIPLASRQGRHVWTSRHHHQHHHHHGVCL
jgi:hypothetical protein